MARSQIPEDAWLWEVRSSSSHLDPDGEGADWTLTYLLRGGADPASGKALPVRVRGHRVDEVLEPRDVQLFCIPTRPIEPFDSRRIIQDAIRRIEDTGVVVQITEAADPGLVQNHRCCQSVASSQRRHHLSSGGRVPLGGLRRTLGVSRDPNSVSFARPPHRVLMAVSWRRRLDCGPNCSEVTFLGVLPCQSHENTPTLRFTNLQLRNVGADIGAGADRLPPSAVAEGALTTAEQGRNSHSNRIKFQGRPAQRIFSFDPDRGHR